MAIKSLPFDKDEIEKIIATYPTPFYIYDEGGIRDNIRKFYKAFSWVSAVNGTSSGNGYGFRNYFAVKACPNPFIMKILQSEGVGADCSSLPELMLARKVGLRGEDVMFTSNDTPASEFVYARKMQAIINLDDITHIDFLERSAGIPNLICFRYNPGHERQGTSFIGNPVDQKYGLTRPQLFEAYKIMKAKGVKRFGLHTMIISNELNPNCFIETARMLFTLVRDISKEVGIRFEFVNLGGGIGIPYRPEQNPVDYQAVSEGIKAEYDNLIANSLDPLDPLRVVFECGRMVTGPYGFLVTTAIHKMQKYKSFIGVDASMANLMRPGMYGAYHHIVVLGKEGEACTHKYDVSGPLCENCDKFAIDRELPEISVGDRLVICDTGAHGHAMGYQYNGRLRSSELLRREDRSIVEIRRRETPKDYFGTLDFSKLKAFDARRGQ